MIATALAGASRLISGAAVQWRCDPGSDSQQVHVAPFADLRRLDLVEVLTKPDATSP